MKLTTALTIAVVALVAGLLLEHHVGPLSSWIRLLHGPAASVEQDVANAGQKAAEDTKDELDAETDDAVAADSDVADQHAADAVERDAADQADEQRARDDLDQRLHDELRATSFATNPASVRCGGRRNHHSHRKHLSTLTLTPTLPTLRSATATARWTRWSKELDHDSADKAVTEAVAEERRVEVPKLAAVTAERDALQGAELRADLWQTVGMIGGGAAVGCIGGTALDLGTVGTLVGCAAGAVGGLLLRIEL